MTAPPTPDTASRSPRKQGVILWFKIYVFLNVLMFLAVGVGSFALGRFAGDWLELDRVERAMFMWLFAPLCLALVLIYGVALFFPEQKWAWI